VEPQTLDTARRLLLGALWLGLAGTGLELLFLEHFEEWRQILPLALVGVGLLVLLWNALDRRALPNQVLQGLMVLFALGGVLGLVFHVRGNAAFELEMYPNRRGLDLVRKTLMGATPALAPGAMIQLALVGLAYCYLDKGQWKREKGKAFTQENL
jgi:hypothetical protein